MFDLLQRWHRAVGESIGGGWVAEISGCLGGCAHPIEKSAADFKDASIHCLSYWQVKLREFGASSSENEARNVWETVVM